MSPTSDKLTETRLVNVHQTLIGDLETPISAFMKLCPRGPAFLLESAAGGGQVARYSFLGYNPFLVVKGYQERMELYWSDGQREYSREGPFVTLRKLLQRFGRPFVPDMPRFCGGAVGYFSYDNVFLLEPIGDYRHDELNLPDTYLQFMENIVVFDHFTHKIHLLVNMPVKQEDNRSFTEQSAGKALQEMARLLGGPVPKDVTFAKSPLKLQPKSNLTKDEFSARVKAAKEYIAAGDIFQVVLSQRFAAPLREDPFIIYRRLRSVNPSPYMFYLRFEDAELVGASPEMLARVDGKTVTTRPIAGTRPRGKTAAEDAALEYELLNDPKERAEHVMLVDLGRNDIGRVAKYGTVKIAGYAGVERFSHVMHLVSEVSGELALGKDALDALTACFPAGTLSGAPKVRAMQIINELETVKRGPYGGAVGYLDFAGNMDTCITIRTAVIKNNTAYVQSGGGIVADSDPDTEYAETMHKAKAMLTALGVI